MVTSDVPKSVFGDFVGVLVGLDCCQKCISGQMADGNLDQSQKWSTMDLLARLIAPQPPDSPVEIPLIQCRAINRTRDGKKFLQPLPHLVRLSKEPCCVTDTDDSDFDRALMTCGHVISVEGMKSLCESVLKDEGYEFLCPICEYEWGPFVVRHILSVVCTYDELAQISQDLNSNFINATDIRQCPTCETNSQRDLSRYGSVENKNKAVCLMCTRSAGTTKAFCWNCSRPWIASDDKKCGNDNCDTSGWKIRDLSICGTKRIAVGLFDGMECPVMRGCPRCGELICHKDRCKHMVCPSRSCGCEFCFVCLSVNDVKGKWKCAAYLNCELAPRQIILNETAV